MERMIWVVILVGFASSVADAREPFARTSIRNVLITRHPAELAEEVYVSGQIATVLRFEYGVDRAKTKLIGWEGRFEPLVIGRNIVVIEPVRDLRSEERVPFTVAMVDGTKVALLLRAPGAEDTEDAWKRLDHQVSFFKDDKSYEAVVNALYRALSREEELRLENQELKKAESSTDHALATLLLNGDLEKTAFHQANRIAVKQGSIQIATEIYAGPGKAAAVVFLNNASNDALWRFSGARVSSNNTEFTARPFAYRVSRQRLEPGEKSIIAAVVDKAAFESDGKPVDLALEVFSETGEPPLRIKLDRTLVQE